MIILSNTCTGSFIYKIKQIPFNTPTCWAMVDYASLRTLCEQVSARNMHFQFEYSLQRSKVNSNTYVIATAPGVQLHFVHYLYSDSELVGNEDGAQRVDIIGKDIVEYVRKHTNERISRMLPDEPVVCVLDAIYNNTEVPNLTSQNLDDFYTWDFPNVQRILVSVNPSRVARYSRTDMFTPVLALNRKPRSNANQLINMGII